MISKRKPEKYLVLSAKQLNTLIEMAHEGSKEKSSSDCVVIKLEHAGKKWPRQLIYTDKFRAKAYRCWRNKNDK
mgnify:CR=1 FL=1